MTLTATARATLPPPIWRTWPAVERYAADHGAAVERLACATCAAPLCPRCLGCHCSDVTCWCFPRQCCNGGAH